MKPEKVKCIRCDEEVSTDPFEEGLTLMFNQEMGAVEVCDDCAEIVKRRDYL